MRNLDQQPYGEIGAGIQPTPDQQARIGQLSLLSYDRPVRPELVSPPPIAEAESLPAPA